MTLALSVKRPLPSTFEDIDSENIDPSIFSSTKKSKGSIEHTLKAEQSSQFVLKNAFTVPRAPGLATRRIATPQRLEAARKSPAPITKTPQPSSAPAAAGGSPKSKRHGIRILSRRRGSSSPFTRIDPPSFGSSNGLPFSIDTLLSSTVTSYRPQKPNEILTLDETHPKGWIFDIHEDGEDELENVLFEHDANRLDISDDSGDEGNHRSKDMRGKENIPPMENTIVGIVPVTTIRPVSRKDMMTDEPRTPLGDLDTKEFYAEGCDESSVIITPPQLLDDKPNATYNIINHVTSSDAVDTHPESHNEWVDSLRRSESVKHSRAGSALAILSELDSHNEAEIEIWESDSANVEEETCANEVAPISV